MDMPGPLGDGGDDELFPVQMEGVKLTVNKGLSNHFQVNHTVALSTLGESNYHFGATYVGTKQLSPTEAFPVLVGDMDNSGSLNAQVIHQLTTRLRSKVAFQKMGDTKKRRFVEKMGSSNEQLQGGGEFEASTRLRDPSVAFGYQLELPKGNLLFRGTGG
ncbi:PREDICTED: mitochondrial import receptor subunit TOM40 homolog, partial [Haliaeetus leucocephalus]|uniref:mitochondrial import receptor subunit TOM40 homolog n=1 Tax=Haliaeetus leucocephalus TaxID=52644 RepID=UPI00053CD20C